MVLGVLIYRLWCSGCSGWILFCLVVTLLLFVLFGRMRFTLVGLIVGVVCGMAGVVGYRCC